MKSQFMEESSHFPLAPAEFPFSLFPLVLCPTVNNEGSTAWSLHDPCVTRAKAKATLDGRAEPPRISVYSHTDPLLQEQPSAGSGTRNVLPTPGVFPGECAMCLGGRALGAFLTEHDLMAL